MFREQGGLYEDMPATERIPSVLMNEYLGKGHVLYVDNFYTSPALADFMLEHDTHVVGTIKATRKNYAPQARNHPLEKGEAAFFAPINGKAILGIKFRAKKDKANGKPKVVCMLTTNNDSSVIDTGKKDRDGNAVMKPTTINDYNHHMTPR
jgi:hypothetical protein